MAIQPSFVISNVGLAAAATAAASIQNGGVSFVNITGFRIGSASGYTPLATDTGLNGTVLYQGIPTSYSYAGNNTINIVCKIPADAGPFDFGEITVDLGTAQVPVMFAKAVFDVPQHKYSSLNTNVLSTYTFNCLIKLSQPVAIFQVNTVSAQPAEIWEVDHWADVFPPSLSANPGTPAILVNELDS